MCIFTLKEAVSSYNALGSHMFLCFMDATAAFDRISYITLFEKLLDRKIPMYIIRILYFWYFNQKLYVRWDSHLSKPFSVTNGVRQGGILLPLLFNVYTYDLSLELNSLHVGCCINYVKLNHLMYADDIVLFAPSLKGLQRLVNVCNDYGSSHSITFNKTKTVCMQVLSKKTSWTVSNPCITLGTERLRFVDKFTYLGCILTSDWTDDEDMHKHVCLLYCKANTLIRKFSQCSEKIRILLYQMYCGTLYCCSLWCRYKQATYTKIKVAYNNAFRILMHLPRFCSAYSMFVHRNTLNFEALLRRSVHSLMQRISKSKNTFVAAIYNSDAQFKSPLFQRFKSVLYV